MVHMHVHFVVNIIITQSNAIKSKTGKRLLKENKSNGLKFYFSSAVQNVIIQYRKMKGVII